MESEPLKIFGSYSENGIINAVMKISASCNRVAVSDGHLESISVKIAKLFLFAQHRNVDTRFENGT